MKRLLVLISFMVALILMLPCLDSAELWYKPYFEGTVVEVIDGDTIDVSYKNARQRVRLYGIDCPEKLQEYGTQARDRTESLAISKTVRVIPIDRDRFGRMVAYVILPDGNNLNYELVSDGLAWWYRSYASHNVQISFRETQARLERKGLWAAEDPVPPWIFRKGISLRNGSFQ